MITAALIIFLVVTLAGLIAVERAVRHAKPGYEDETGFHFESQAVVPAPVAVEKRQVRRFRPSRGLTHAA
jgi:hypothetical protein